MACLDEQTVLALALGQLPEPARRTTETHLDGCSSCLALVAEMVRATGSQPATPGPATTVSDGDRYELGAEIARGGMGRIHEAFDRRLGRHVAIKCALRNSPALAARFQREVALTSRLEHPAIVPIHDAGTLGDGTAFYAMRLVVGRTLDRSIADADTLAKRLSLVPRVIAVADAVAYAHSQQIIHRDLKPQNILVGEFGETVLLDWGLAKDLRATETAEPDTRDDAGLADGTRAGDVIGTPGYMAPEQAEATTAIGIAADVYGLGATLHHLLTGQVPRTAPLPPLAAREIPPDLVAIVARATAEDAEDRYPSARELAADLHRFQAGRLVEAHRYTRWQLVTRWIGRHRAAVAVGAAAVAVIATLSVLGLRRIVSEHDAALAAQARAETQRDAAEDVVGFMVGDMHDRLDGLGRLDLLAGASQRVVDYYARLGHAGQASAVAHHLAALQALGEAQQVAGDHAKAIAAFREQLALAKAAHRADRTCWALVKLGQEQRALAKADESQASFEECARIAATAPEHDSEPWSRVRAAAGIELAKLAWGRRDLKEARRLATEANADGRRIVDAGQRSRGYAIILNASVYIAQWAMQQEDWKQARASAEEALTAARQQPPDAFDTLQGTASALTILAQVEDHEGANTAEATYGEARALLTTLSTREPNDMKIRRSLLNVETLLGRRARDRGDPRGALPHLSASLRLAQEAAAPARDSPDAMRDLAVAEIDLAQAQEALGDLPAARDTYRRAVDDFERVVTLAPGERAGKLELAFALDSRAEFELKAGDHAAVQASAARALELLAPLAQLPDDPDLSEFRTELADHARHAR